ncbi:MAG: hypothetical protein MJZ16_09290 [Bacteroidales bacterium]|nr:hypothetical protein [Bacteroidales bacterium]
MKRFLLLALAGLAIGSVSSSAETIRFAYRPSLSPDAKQIYFSYDGDIFSVPVAGGLATSVINLGGNENNPLVSPDGKWLAFSSDIMGNNDIYVMPLGGGKAVQLTYHEAPDVAISWSADSKYIYFESTRGSARKTTYKVSINGGTPELLFDGYFNTIVNVVENPKTGEILFNESMESISFPTRKRYVGDHNPNIKSYNPKSKEYKELTSYIGKDTWPMVDKSGNIYYVSDEANLESNIVKYVKGGKPEQLTSFDKSVQYPTISADGSAIVFLKDYEINVLDPKTGKVSVPEIKIAESGAAIKRQFSEQKPSAAAVSPDGKKFALVIRGELYVSDAKCEYLQKLATPSNERVSEVAWAKDNKTIFYTRTNKGWTDLYKIAGDNSSKEVAVYNSSANTKGLKVSNKKDKLAFIDGSKSVMLCNMESGSVEKIADAEFWSFQNYDISFSADDSYLAFDAMDRFESDIFVYSFKDKKLTNMTHSASTEGSMVFSPDEKNMYFLTNPTSSTFPKRTRAYLYKLPLQRYETPFKSDKFDKLFADDAKKSYAPAAAKSDAAASKKNSSKKAAAEQPKPETKKESKKDTSIVIDFNDIYKRMTRVERSGYQNNPYVFATKNKSLLFYTSSGDGQGGLYALDLSDPEAKPKQVTLKGGSGYGTFFSSDNDLYALSGGTILKIDPNSLNGTAISVSKNVEKVLSDEFSQMFYETWAVLEQNYYDVNFHGADWYTVRDYYASLLPYVRTRENLRTVIADMLGELNSSHLGFTSTGAEETTATKTRTIETGIVFDNKNPYKVDRIIAYSPADKFEIDIRKGDELVAINGEKIDPSVNREKYLSSPVSADEVKFTFKRGGKEFDVKLHTTTFSAVKTLAYNEWENRGEDT